MRILTAAAAALAISAGAAQAQQGGERPVPQSVWKMDGDTAEHLQSGLRCPQGMAEYSRVAITVYDGYGLDVSCGWNSRNAVVTLYLMRRGPLEPAFVGAQGELLKSPILKNPRATSDGTVQQGGLAWRRAEYVEDGGKQSDLWMADLSGWILEYRATYFPQVKGSVDRQLAALTEIARASAGKQLALCAKSSPPPRPGKAARRRNDGADGLMGALLGAVAAGAAQEKGAPAAEPITYCVEDPAPGQRSPMLAWRGVLPDGADAKTDRLTPMTMGPPPALDTALDEAGSIIAAELSGGRKTPRWIATMADAKRTDIFGYYDGRPSAKTLAPLLQGILDGKAHPISSVSADGKDITITTPK